jgi:hypothetical protein
LVSLGIVTRLFASCAVVVAALGVALAAAPARADGDPVTSLLAQMENTDPTLQTYRANVEFTVGLHTFPFVRKTLHGDAYFKRPSRMEIVFTDLPAFAKRFSNLYVGLGTPRDWERKFSIAAVNVPGGHPYLILTPRASGGRLRHVDVYVDPASWLPARIVWTYVDGRIEMVQTIVARDGHHVIGAQTADIRMPWGHAYARARIEDYAINVPIDDAVFTTPAPSPGATQPSDDTKP